MNMMNFIEKLMSGQFFIKNDLLCILILVFGFVDFVLICVYVVVFKFNGCKLIDNVEIENIRYFFGNNLMYENIEIVFIN